MFPFDPNRGVSDPSRWNALWTVTSRPSRPVGAVSRWKHWGSRPRPMPLPTSFLLTRLPHRTPDFPLMSQKRSRMAPVTRHSAAPSRSTHSIPGHGRRQANKCRSLHRCSVFHGITSGAPAHHALPVETGARGRTRWNRRSGASARDPATGVAGSRALCVSSTGPSPTPNGGSAGSPRSCSTTRPAPPPRRRTGSARRSGREKGSGPLTASPRLRYAGWDEVARRRGHAPGRGAACRNR